jgi:hypothetical protein
MTKREFRDFLQDILSREAQLFVGWVSGSVTHADVGLKYETWILTLLK